MVRGAADDRVGLRVLWLRHRPSAHCRNSVFAPTLPRDTAQCELVLAHTDYVVKHRRLATPEPELDSRDSTMRRTQLLCGAALLALCTQTLSAQQTRTSVPLLGFSVGTMSMD